MHGAELTVDMFCGLPLHYLQCWWIGMQHILNPAVGGGAQRIVLRRLDVTARLRDQDSLAGLAAPADRARSLWRSMLEEHAARSSPDPTPPLQDGTDDAAWGDSLPRWSLKCSREQQLQQLCLSFTLQCTEVLKQVSACLTLVTASPLPAVRGTHGHASEVQFCGLRGLKCPGDAELHCPHATALMHRTTCSRGWNEPACSMRPGPGTWCTFSSSPWQVSRKGRRQVSATSGGRFATMSMCGRDVTHVNRMV
jgi:hypothetical protein